MAGFTIGQASGVDTNVRLRAALSLLVAGGGGSLRSRTGMLGNGLITTRTAGMGLAVSAGRVWVQGTADLQYGYPVVFDAATALTLDDGSAAARTDIVCVQVRDNAFDGTGQTGPRIFVVKGASGGGVPSTPAGCVKLAEQPVPANASAGAGGLTADPVDRRPPRTAAQGGIPVVVDRADADTGLSLYDGLKVYRLDTGKFESRAGGAWVVDPTAADVAATVRRFDGTETPILGTKPPAGTAKIIREGSSVLTTSGGSYVTLPVPAAIANGITYMLLSPGDLGSNPQLQTVVPSLVNPASTMSNINALALARGNAGLASQSIRVNWQIVGW